MMMIIIISAQNSTHRSQPEKSALATVGLGLRFFKNKNLEKSKKSKI